MSAVVCGSFRRGHAELREAHQSLERAGCRILSPVAVDFVDERDGFVFAAHERSSSPEQIEAEHLRAIGRAHFVWLHAPDGYVGTSASMELGYARALGIPVFGHTDPADVGLVGMVQPVASPDAAVRLAREVRLPAPSRGLTPLQSYYARVAERRGYAHESARDCLLLLTEEVGELARAIRKDAGLARDGGHGTIESAAELADVQLYVVHLANVLGVDLSVAVSEKESLNESRFQSHSAAEAA
jgi:NTP pyrophosphatase (non-canonical NTP hydrolase)